MTTQSDTIMAARPSRSFSAGLPAAGLTPEFLLTAACCRWPPSQARTDSIRAAAADIVDWEPFLRQVRRQRVAGLANAALAAAGIELPPPIAAVLSRQARRIVRTNLDFAFETLRLQRALEAEGIAALALKGVGLALLAYGSLDLKQARDMDFLIPPECAEAALRLLEGEGYVIWSPAQNLSPRQRRSLIRFAKEAELFHPGRQLHLELHWHAANNPLLLQGVEARSAAQSVDLSGRGAIRILAPGDQFAYLCVHGARHAWSRLKWLADVNALLATTAPDIGALYRHAQRAGAGLCAGQTLLLCRQLLALRLPPDLADEISANKRVRTLVGIGLRAMTAPHTETEVDGGVAGVARSVYTQFLLGQGLPFYAAQLRAASVTPVDVVLVPLPPFLHFLYPLLRLPLWVWRRAAGAFRARNGS
ncbi:MAG TPA: nucleotidyltransferase family protein [Xanthobacteraceae bacterium]